MATNSFGPVNTGQTGLTGLLGGVSTGADDFLRAAQGMLALQNARREQTQQHGSDILSLFARAAQGNPALLDDPTFQSHVTQVAQKLGLPGGGTSSGEVAGVLGMPTLQDILAQPGVLGSIEESPSGSGRTATAEALLGRKLAPGQEATVQGLPQQFPPAQQAAVIGRLESGLANAESSTAKYNNPNILIDYVQRNQPLYERLYGADAAKSMLDTSLAQNLAQMSPLQLSTLEKNKAYSKYLGERGIDIQQTREARIGELLSRSAANQARAGYENAQIKALPNRMRMWTNMASYYDGRSDMERATAQMTREEAKRFAETGMTSRDAVSLRGDLMRTMQGNATTITRLQSDITKNQKALANPLLNAQQKQQLQSSIDAESNTLKSFTSIYNSDQQTLNTINQRFSSGVFSAPPELSTGSAGSITPAAGAVAGLPSGSTLYGHYSDGREVYLTPSGTYVFADGSAVPQ
jgi:hypothetical protein